MYITESYKLPRNFVDHLHRKVPQFGLNGLGEFVYYRTYSRVMDDGRQESWADTIVRVVEGVFSILLTHRTKIGKDPYGGLMDYDAMHMADLMFNMKFLPPGRGLWAMGTPYVAERGAMALYNCAATDITDLAEDAAWLMDLCMCGVGVGFSTECSYLTGIPARIPYGVPEVYIVPDSREGWVESVRRLIRSYTHQVHPIRFDYSEIRPAGAPIRGFGGTSSGHKPLELLHERIQGYLCAFALGDMSTTRLIADIMNSIGACVVAGNVRRSAEIALGNPGDLNFMNLKDYTKYDKEGNVTYVGTADDRQSIGWLSNNSVVLKHPDDFMYLPEVADQIRANRGEPGILNLMNVQRYGRMHRESHDAATLCNPCGEIPLESKEVCNLVEVFPTMCSSYEELKMASRYATMYASYVSLLPTHRPETNAIVEKNRRIGVSLSGIADWIDAVGAASATKSIRNLFGVVVGMNRRLAELNEVNPSIRVTTVKPSGTVSLLPGVSSGMHYPVARHAIRRVRVGEHSPVVQAAMRSGVPFEEDVVNPGTYVFSFPVFHGTTRTASEVSMWEQATLLAMLQREWADNMVSCTIYFDPEREGPHIEKLLGQYAPIIKSMSMLPHEEQGEYAQMPYEGISEARYNEEVAKIQKIDWAKFNGSDGEDDRYCSGDRCEVKFNWTE